jgi:hypothetical protein
VDDLLGSSEEDLYTEEALPPQEIGSEALRAELAFKLEEELSGRARNRQRPRHGPPKPGPLGPSSKRRSSSTRTH